MNAYQTSGFAYQGAGLFAYQGGGGTPPGPTQPQPEGGGDSTRIRHRKRRGKRLRYWWEKDDAEQLAQGLEKVTVLTPEQAMLDPVAVEALWEEKAELDGYIIEMSVSRTNARVVEQLQRVNQWMQARIDAETARKRRIKKKLMLLLGGD